MDRNLSQKIKGVSICMMVIRHLFIVDWHISSAPAVPYYLSAIAHTCKICVAIYCFLTGYAYAFAKNKNIRYGMERSINLLKHYWLQLCLLFVPLAIICGQTITPQLVVCTMFGLPPSLNYFSWYVYFYIFAMVALPICMRGEILWKKTWIGVAAVILVSYGTGLLLHSLPLYEENAVIAALFNCTLYFPGVIFGYACAKYKVFAWLDAHLWRGTWWYALGAVFVLSCRTVISSIMGLPLDIYYAPLFIYCIYRILTDKRLSFFGKVLSIFGRYSTQIWFFHGIFFAAYVRDYCQWIIWLPRNPILVFAWCMMICLLAAVPLELLAKAIDKLVGMMRKKINV